LNRFTKEYQKKLSLAYKIYEELYGSEYETHAQWAEAFNIRGRIVRCLIKK